MRSLSRTWCWTFGLLTLSWLGGCPIDPGAEPPEEQEGSTLQSSSSADTTVSTGSSSGGTSGVASSGTASSTNVTSVTTTSSTQTSGANSSNADTSGAVTSSNNSSGAATSGSDTSGNATSIVDSSGSATSTDNSSGVIPSSGTATSGNDTSIDNSSGTATSTISDTSGEISSSGVATSGASSGSAPSSATNSSGAATSVTQSSSAATSGHASSGTATSGSQQRRCSQADPCGSDAEYCDYNPDTCGTNGETGRCQPRPAPSDCGATVEPVCGCDDRTYPNSCAAAVAGYDVKSAGSCVGTMPCSRAMGLKCDAKQYCDYEPNTCGSSNEFGTCRDKPTSCPLEILQPVCGCDNVDYSNECEARLAGQDVAHAGTCAGNASCSAMTEQCDTYAYCEYLDNSCGDNGSTGTCQPKPTLCEALDDVQCGCNNTDFKNLCEAHLAGWDVRAAGSCSTLTKCTSSADCDSESFCDFTPDKCGLDGSAGWCRPFLTSCDSIPVCGCDHRGYENACAASRARTDISSSMMTCLGGGG